MTGLRNRHFAKAVSSGLIAGMFMVSPAMSDDTSAGGRPLDRMHFTDAGCSLAFPGKPTASYSTAMGPRAVQYAYSDGNGVYLFQYFNTASAVVPGAANFMYDRINASLLKSLKKGQYSQHSASMPVGLARQIDVTKLPFAAQGAPADSVGRIRLFANGIHVYMLAAFGRRAWLESANVGDFLNGLGLPISQRQANVDMVKAHAKMNDDFEAHKRQNDAMEKEREWRNKRDAATIERYKNWNPGN